MESHVRQLLKRRVPGQLVIQITDRCNALCPQCGMRSTEPFERSDLPVDEIKRILDRAAENGVQIVSFTGGEPLLRIRELPLLIDYAAGAGIPYIRTGTNGYMFASPERSKFEARVNRLAEALSNTRLRNFWISIDSAAPSEHERMRGFPGLIEGIRHAIPIFHQHGIFPSANLGINRNITGRPLGSYREGLCNGNAAYLGELRADFKTAFDEFYRFVIDLGFTIVNMCYPMSVEPEAFRGGGLSAVYGATSQEDLVKFSSTEKAVIYEALMDTIPRYRSRIRIFSPRSSLHSLAEQHRGNPNGGYPCRGGIDYFFVDARGGCAYPCGYRGGENLGRYLDMKSAGDLGTSCRRCDWECFRDPSELLGPILAARSSPGMLVGDVARNPRRFALWLSDLRYYIACDLFDGRKPPRYERLKKFAAG